MHQMDPYEVTRLMYAKVQSVDPKNVSKIMGYLLLQDQAEQDLLLALGSDAFLCSMVAKAKNDLGLCAADAHSWPSTDQSIPPLQFPATTQSNHLIPMPSDHSAAVGAGLYHAQSMYPLINSHFSAASFHKQQQQQQQGFHRTNMSNQDSHQQQALFGGMFPNDHFYPESFAFLNRSRLKQQQQQLDDVINSHSEHGSPNSSGSNSNAWKPCVYFSRGHCKHGSSCRFLHIPNCASSNGEEWEDEMMMMMMMRPLPLEKLEMELQELLRGRKTPISVATLPQLYYENFGKPLQADKYLTESQRHGKAGSSLTKLLARLKSTVVLIDQSHGQALALVEDVSRFVGHRGENYDHSGNSPSSRQIYLTFPAESTFSEEDVSAHFSAYGAVQDVRIPYQQKRMFGFVTFLHSDTVKVILSEGNPHYICGARVLVKPYREKGKHSDNHRKNSDQSRYFQNGNNALTNRDVLGASKLFEENMLAIQLQRGNSLHLERRLAELQLASVQKYCAEAQVHASIATSREQMQQNSNEKLHRTQDEVSPHHNSNLRCLLGVPDGEIDDSLEELHNNASSNSQLGTESLPESPFAVAYDIKQEVALCTSEMEGFSLNDSSSSEVNQQWLQRYHTEQEFY